MAYGDYDGPDKPDKGHEGGSCNRQRCQAEPAVWFSHGSNSWYCVDCKDAITNDTFNLKEWEYRWRPKLGHDRFETREMMEARDAYSAPGYLTAPPPKPVRYEDLPEAR